MSNVVSIDRGRLDLSVDQMALLDQHSGIAYAVARRLAAVWAYRDCDDLQQVALVGLIKAIKTFDPSRGLAFGAYAHTRAKFAVVDYIRSQRGRHGERARGHLSLSDFDEGGDDARDCEGSGGGGLRMPAALVDASAGSEDIWFGERLQAAMCSLDERERLTIELSFFRGLGGSEIARHLDISESRVSQLLRRAVGKLRAALLPDDEPGPAIAAAWFRTAAARRVA